MKLHVNWGHASAHQLKRAPVYSDGENVHLANYIIGIPLGAPHLFGAFFRLNRVVLSIVTESFMMRTGKKKEKEEEEEEENGNGSLEMTPP